MPESTIRVLRDDCPYAENLVGVLGWRIHVEREASLFESKRCRGEKISMQVIVKPKVFLSSQPSGQKIYFFMLLSSSGSKIFYSTTCIVDGNDENRVDQSLIFFFQFWVQLFLQGRMISWDWSLCRLHWKLFKWSFHSRRWSRRRCRISNLDNYEDQKNHLDKDA